MDSEREMAYWLYAKGTMTIEPDDEYICIYWKEEGTSTEVLGIGPTASTALRNVYNIVVKVLQERSLE